MVVGWPRSQFDANRKDVEGSYMKSFALAPAFAERMQAPSGRRASWARATWRASSCKPYGPGWALVGDAGYHKHPITAFGITDAFRDAEAVASALDDTFAGRRSFDDARTGCDAGVES